MLLAAVISNEHLAPTRTERERDSKVEEARELLEGGSLQERVSAQVLNAVEANGVVQTAPFASGRVSYSGERNDSGSITVVLIADSESGEVLSTIESIRLVYDSTLLAATVAAEGGFFALDCTDVAVETARIVALCESPPAVASARVLRGATVELELRPLHSTVTVFGRATDAQGVGFQELHVSVSQPHERGWRGSERVLSCDDGHWSFDVSANEDQSTTLRLRFEALGFDAHNVEVVADTGEWLIGPVDVALQRRRALRGRVITEAGEAVANAVVDTVLPMAVTEGRRVRTSDDGSFATDLTTRLVTYGLWVVHSDHVPAFHVLTPNEVECGEVVVVLSDGAVIEGRILVAEGTDVVGRRVQADLVPAAKELVDVHVWSQVVHADADGRFKFTRVPRGVIEVSIGVHGAPVDEAEVPIARRVRTVDTRADPQATVEFEEVALVRVHGRLGKCEFLRQPYLRLERLDFISGAEVWSLVGRARGEVNSPFAFEVEGASSGTRLRLLVHASPLDYAEHEWVVVGPELDVGELSYLGPNAIDQFDRGSGIFIVRPP